MGFRETTAAAFEWRCIAFTKLPATTAWLAGNLWLRALGIGAQLLRIRAFWQRLAALELLLLF
jgi:hypothetical protein